MSGRRASRDAAALHGVLVVDKPVGVTSAAVVSMVRERLGFDRVGHTGTLDPLATGVLPLALGEATKLAGYLLADDKAYEGELALGVETDTLDAEGTVTATDPAGAAAVDEAALRAALARFVGEQLQVPPMFSAIKQKGQRLHELARAGQEVDRAPRLIRIDRLELLGFEPAAGQPAGSAASPRARFVVECSKGTYVRSLVADLGRALGCGAHLTALRRTRSGPFSLEQALQIPAITRESVPRALLSPAQVLPFRSVAVPDHAIAAIRNGNPLTWQGFLAGEAPPPGQLVKLCSADGDLLALADVSAGRLRYQRVFTYALTKAAASSNLQRSKHPKN